MTQRVFNRFRLCLLLDDKYFDHLSGQQAYKRFACRVKKPQASDTFPTK